MSNRKCITITDVRSAGAREVDRETIECRFVAEESEIVLRIDRGAFLLLIESMTRLADDLDHDSTIPSPEAIINVGCDDAGRVVFLAPVGGQHFCMKLSPRRARTLAIELMRLADLAGTHVRLR